MSGGMISFDHRSALKCCMIRDLPTSSIRLDSVSKLAYRECLYPGENTSHATLASPSRVRCLCSFLVCPCTVHQSGRTQKRRPDRGRRTPAVSATDGRSDLQLWRAWVSGIRNVEVRHQHSREERLHA